MKLIRSTKSDRLLVLILASLTIISQNNKANAFDMDCKVILCIAGGFPVSCGDAYGYMIDRITHKPPQPPFGFCAMSNGSEYKGQNVDYRFLYRGSDAYDCPVGKSIFYQANDDEDYGTHNDTAFCYSHTTLFNTYGDDNDSRVIYHNRSSAIPINFELKITIEPGTSNEYRSPLIRVNTYTGYFSQKPVSD